MTVNRCKWLDYNSYLCILWNALLLLNCFLLPKHLTIQSSIFVVHFFCRTQLTCRGRLRPWPWTSLWRPGLSIGIRACFSTYASLPMFIKIPAMTFIIKPVTASPNDHPSENDSVDNVVPYNMAPTIPKTPENKWYTTLQRFWITSMIDS